MVIALRVFGRLMFWLSLVLLVALALAWAWDRSDKLSAAGPEDTAPATVPATV